jgi:photosystem II stability/assembly factor-like uncharacterized protein
MIARIAQSFSPPSLPTIFKPMLQWVVLLTVVAVNVFAGQNGRFRVYRSEDRGQTWTRSDSGLAGDARINAFSATGNSVVAGIDSGIFVSADSGRTWQRSNITGPNAARAVALAAVNNYLFAGSDRSVLSSSDGGRTWLTNRSFPRQIVRSLLGVDGALYVGTDNMGVYKTREFGSSSNRWTQLLTGLPPNAQVLALAANGNILFAGLYPKGLYQWNDSEQKWFQAGASAEIKPLVLATGGKTLVAGHNPGGIYSSDDLGETWRHWTLSTESMPVTDITESFSSFESVLNNTRGASLPPLQAPIWEMAGDPRIIIAGAGTGIYYSTDRARTWSRATMGLPSNGPGIAFLVKENFILGAVHEKEAGCADK